VRAKPHMTFRYHIHDSLAILTLAHIDPTLTAIVAALCGSCSLRPFANRRKCKQSSESSVMWGESDLRFSAPPSPGIVPYDEPEYSIHCKGSKRASFPLETLHWSTALGQETRRPGAAAWKRQDRGRRFIEQHQAPSYYSRPSA